MPGCQAWGGFCMGSILPISISSIRSPIWIERSDEKRKGTRKRKGEEERVKLLRLGIGCRPSVVRHQILLKRIRRMLLFIFMCIGLILSHDRHLPWIYDYSILGAFVGAWLYLRRRKDEKKNPNGWGFRKAGFTIQLFVSRSCLGLKIILWCHRQSYRRSSSVAQTGRSTRPAT